MFKTTKALELSRLELSMISEALEVDVEDALRDYAGARTKQDAERRWDRLKSLESLHDRIERARKSLNPCYS